ncbi:MAG: hypothetical protein AB1772_04180 [Candidatus Zixiibacteriota bacterium]
MLHGKAVLTVLALVVGVAGQSWGIQRVAARFAYLELRFAYAMPQGEYDGLPGSEFETNDGYGLEIDGTHIYEDGYSFGLAYGRLFEGKWALGAGFEYARHRVKNPIVVPGFEPVRFPERSTYHHYAIALRATYSPLDLKESGWSPYLGPAATFGLAALTSPGYITEYEADFGLDIEFGLDVTLWQAADNRSFLALSSINSWNFLATDDRVSHLQIGGGIRYFFKP